MHWGYIEPINYVTKVSTVDSHGILEFHKRDIFSNEIMIVRLLQTWNIWQKDYCRWKNSSSRVKRCQIKM